MLVKQRSSNFLACWEGALKFVCAIRNKSQRRSKITRSIHSFTHSCDAVFWRWSFLFLSYAVTHLHRQQHTILGSHIYLLIIHLFVVQKLMSLSWKFIVDLRFKLSVTHVRHILRSNSSTLTPYRLWSMVKLY